MGVERGTRATRKDAFCGCLVLLAFVALAFARPGIRRKITPVLQARLENIFWQIRSSCKVMQLELVLKGLEASPHPVLEPAVPLNDRHCLHPQCGETQQGLLLNKLVR